MNNKMDLVKLIEQQLENQNNQEQEIIEQWGSLENYKWYQKGFYDGYEYIYGSEEYKLDCDSGEEALIKKYGSIENFKLYIKGSIKGFHYFSEDAYIEEIMNEYLDSSELEYEQILDEINLSTMQIEAKL